MKAMIFAAGLGTRMKPLTDHRPKALVEIEGKTLLERCILYLKANGVSEIIINVHHFSGQIIDFLHQNNNFGTAIKISDESDALLDTGGGILKAKSLLEGDQPILILNVDILTNLDLNRLLDYHTSNKALATLVVRDRLTSRYLLFDRENYLSGWKNTKTGELKVSRPNQLEETTPLAFSGIHIIQPELLNKILENGKFSIIDLYLRLAKSEKIIAFHDTHSTWMDLGKFEEMEQAAALIRGLN